MKAIQYKDFYAKIKHITTFYGGGGCPRGPCVKSMVPKFQGRSFHMGEINTARNEN